MYGMHMVASAIPRRVATALSRHVAYPQAPAVEFILGSILLHDLQRFLDLLFVNSGKERSCSRTFVPGAATRWKGKNVRLRMAAYSIDLLPCEKGAPPAPHDGPLIQEPSQAFSSNKAGV